MKPAAFAYRRVTTIAEAVGILGEHGDEAKVLAGGQSLMPLLNMRLAVPSVVVDIGGVAELTGTHAADTGATRFGARVVHSAVEDGRVPDHWAGLLRATAAGIGYRAIRNRGTIGGSLAHSDASAEWPIVLAALGARVIARSVRGERTVPCREFVLGYFTNALHDDELLVAVDVPPVPERTRWGLVKSARRPGEFAESLAVAVSRLDADGRVDSADVWLGAAGDVPLRLPAVEQALVRRRPDEVPADDVAALVRGTLRETSGALTRYATHLHGVTVARAVARLAREVHQ